MAAHPIVVVDEELQRRLPREFQQDPLYQRGALIELVPVAAPAKQATADDALAAWESLRGILAHSELDPNAELEREKERELEEEARWARD